MLQWIQNWLGYTASPATPRSVALITVKQDPPKLRVSLAISHPTFSLSMPQTPPVMVTIKVQVEGMEPITVHTHGSMLDSRTHQMFAEGFSFMDVETGKYLHRLGINFCTFNNNEDSGVQEIPAVMSGQPPYEIQHKLYIPSFMETREMGFEVGHTYEVGLRTMMGGMVTWWRMGRKEAVYPSGRAMPRGLDSYGHSYLRFMENNSVTFMAVA